MLTDKQFEQTRQPRETVSYKAFGFVDCPEHEAIGMVRQTRLGATFYYVQLGTMDEPKWQPTDYEGYFEHCKAIQVQP